LLGVPRDRKAVGALVFARIVYAVNWLNVGAIFYLMGPDLGVGVSGLGSVTAAFYLGIGLAQVPGGLLAARWGPKKVVVLGIFVSSLSALGTAAAASLAEVFALRLVVGAGMALVFAPGVVIVARLLGGSKSGSGVGLFNSAFDLGGLIGIFGWVVVATATGWRPSLLISGGVGVVTGALVALFVPGDEARGEFKVRRSALLAILRDRQLLLLGLGTLGFSIGNTIISGFMVYYLEKSLGVASSLAGLIAALVVLVPIFTALAGGGIYDKVTRHRRMMVLALLGSVAALVLGAYPSVYAAAGCAALGGVVSGVGYTFAFAGARDLNRGDKEYEGLAIAWVNSISLTGSFLPPVFFSYFAEAFGYTDAWLGSALISLAFLVPLLMMAEGWTR
jgi:MFS transporter, ACS family, glucarate transporter